MKKLRGFTLLELTIVIIIIAILAVIALPTFLRMAERGKGAKAKGNMNSILKGAKILATVGDGTYPTFTNDAQINTQAFCYLQEVPELDNLQFDNDWNYTATGTNAATFTVCAERTGGIWNGQTIWITQNGLTGFGNWQ